MKEHHNVPLIGHVGVHRTVDHIKRAFQWKGLWSDARQYVLSCSVCQLMKLDHRKERRESCSQSPFQNVNGNNLQLTRLAESRRG